MSQILLIPFFGGDTLKVDGGGIIYENYDR